MALKIIEDSMLACHTPCRCHERSVYSIMKMRSPLGPEFGAARRERRHGRHRPSARPVDEHLLDAHRGHGCEPPLDLAQLHVAQLLWVLEDLSAPLRPGISGVCQEITFTPCKRRQNDSFQACLQGWERCCTSTVGNRSRPVKVSPEPDFIMPYPSLSCFTVSCFIRTDI